jgi:hypothetical protein
MQWRVAALFVVDVGRFINHTAPLSSKREICSD